MKRGWASFWVGVAVWLAAGVASAQQGSAAISLHWSAPDECPDDVALVHQIERLLGQSLLEVREQSLAVWVTAYGDATRGYAAKVSFQSLQGREQRYLEHPSCRKLADAVSLMIALAIDPERVRATQQVNELQAPASVVEPAPRAPAPQAAKPVALVDVPSRSPAPHSEPARQGLRLTLHGVTGGPLPRFGVGLQAGLAWHRERLRLELLTRYWLTRDVAVQGAPSAALELELVTWGGRGCWQTDARAWQFAVCGGGDLGVEHGQGVGTGFDPGRSKNAAYGQLAGGVRAGFVRSRLMPEAGVELSSAFLASPFGVHENGSERVVVRAPTWAVTALFGLAFEL